jgi:hypothetical protein
MHGLISLSELFHTTSLSDFVHSRLLRLSNHHTASSVTATKIERMAAR